MEISSLVSSPSSRATMQNLNLVDYFKVKWDSHQKITSPPKALVELCAIPMHSKIFLIDLTLVLVKKNLVEIKYEVFID